MQTKVTIDFIHNLLSVVKKGTLGGGTEIYEGLPVIGPNESQQSRLKLYGLDAINLSLLELLILVENGVSGNE